MKHILKILIILVISANFAYANSILTRDNPGESGTDGDARAMAMGGALLSLTDGSNGNITNPAIAASYNQTMFVLSFERNYINYEVPYGTSVNISYDVPKLNLTFPVHNRITLSIGLNERYDRNFEITAPIYDSGEFVGVRRVVGKGAIYSASFGLANRFFDKLYVGVAGHYHFGAPKDLWQRDYYEKGYSNTEIEMKDSVGGPLVAAGVAYDVTKYLSVGGFAEIPLTLNVEHTTSIEYGDLYESEAEFTLPMRAGFGGSLKLGKRILVSADGVYNRWSSFAVDGVARSTYKDTIEIRGGGEFLPSTDKKALIFFRMPYRIGASFQPWYDTSRGDLNKMTVSVGTGYIFPQNERSKLDIAFEYGQRGSLESNGLQEEIFNLYLSLTGIESWLNRSEEE